MTPNTSWKRLLPIIQVAVWAFLLTAVVPVQAEDLDSTVGDPQGLAHPHADACVWTGGACEWDYHMQAMTAVFEQGREETFYAYVEPDVATYYNQTEGSMRVVEPDFNGMFMKFVNVSPMSVRVHWVPDNYPNEDLVYICDIEPFGAAGTTAYPNHKFQMTRQDKPDKIVTTFTATKGQNIYAFEPFQGDYGKAYQKLKKPADFQNYMLQHNNLLFAEQYKEKTGREWLALYGHRSPPHFHMWPAESLGQTHTITTKEIHFVDLPPAEELAKGISLYGPRPEEITRNRKHRDTYPTINLTLTVLSAAPRVFEIQNFLSDVEIEHILSIADQTELSKSTTKAGSAAYAQDDETTRTSTNAWMGRHESIVLDAIYRRAADVLQIDEKFLRYRRKLEIPEFSESKVGIAESLQLVHYDVGQKYTPHHDFVVPGLVRGQPCRFATILFYLNDDMEGGETTFPMWRNAETSNALTVKPEKGKAILFYNVLPDGNFDELSMHSSSPVTEGEKWLTNLWVWDPVLAHA